MGVLVKTIGLWANNPKGFFHKIMRGLVVMAMLERVVQQETHTYSHCN